MKSRRNQIRVSVAVAAIVMSVVGASLTLPARAVQPSDASPSATLAQQTAAAASTKRVSRQFSQYRYFPVPSLNTCLGVWVKGTISAERVSQYSSEAFYVHLRKPRVSNTYMLTNLKKSCDDNAGYTSPANVFRHTMMAYGHSCSYSPSFTVGLPWAVGATITPDCGSKRTAHHRATHNRAGNAHRFEMSANGYAAGWSAKTGAIVAGTGRSVKLCTSLAGYFMLKDNVGKVRKTAYRKGQFSDVCISTS